jgi:hypothetical protein
MSVLPLIVGFALQWNKGAHLGKTPEQIVAMGRTKWTQLYQKKKGISTADMCDGQNKFGEALENLNNRALKRIDPSKRKWLESVRKEMSTYASNSITCASNLTGGGTIWNISYASIRADVEELISDCITKKPMPTIKLMSFESAFELMDKKLVTVPQSEELLKNKQTFLQHHKQVQPLIKKGSPDDSLRWTLFMHQKIENIYKFGEDL